MDGKKFNILVSSTAWDTEAQMRKKEGKVAVKERAIVFNIRYIHKWERGGVSLPGDMYNMTDEEITTVLQLKHPERSD